MLNAFLVALAVFICVGGAELIGFTMLNRPIVIGPLVGLFLGDLHTGVVVGASLEAVFMGVVNIGGASAAEPGIATAVGTAFAIMLGKGSEVALTLALPIGILGLQIKTVLYIFVVGMFAKTFDRLAAEGKERQIIFLHYGLWTVNWALYSLVAFLGILFGSDAVSALLEAIPEVVMNGLTVCGGLLPAVGMAMLMKMLWDKKICMFYFLGFVLATVSIQGLFKFYTIISFAVPFLMLGLPLFDTCFAILRRLAKGQSPMAPDRSHVHHRLIDMGFNQKQAVAILYVISAILGLSAVVLTTSGALKAMVLLCALCLAGLISGKIFLSHNENHQEKTKEKESNDHAIESHDDLRDPPGGGEDGPSGKGTGEQS